MQKNPTIIFFTLLILWTLPGFSPDLKAQEPDQKRRNDPISVVAVKAEQLKEDAYISGTGTLFTDQDVTVMASITGDVQKIFVDEGDYVKKGKPLVMLEQTEVKIGLSQAQHQLEAAKLTLEQTKIDFERTKTLVESKSVPQSQYDGIKLKLDLCENQVNLAEDGLNMARKRVDDTTIKAPFDCYVISRLIGIGSRITAMPPTVLFRIIDLENLTFKMSLPEQQLLRLAERDRIDIHFNSIKSDYSGSIFKIINLIDPRSMNFTVTVKIDNKKRGLSLKPGLFGNAKIYRKQLENSYIIEKKTVCALPDDAKKVKIFLVQNGKVKVKTVEVEEIDAARYRVIAGLSQEDDVIVSGIETLTDGMSVTILKKNHV
jgi:RND family efflux transporter MFP subunit